MGAGIRPSRLLGDARPLIAAQDARVGDALAVMARTGELAWAMMEVRLRPAEPPIAFPGHPPAGPLIEPHDVIAAAWRRGPGQRVPTLPFGDPSHDLGASWLDWLEREIVSWRHEETCLRLLVAILVGGDGREVVRASDGLCRVLKERYRLTLADRA